MEALSAFADAGRLPVPGADPAGRDPSSSPEFRYLLEQMRRRGRGAAPQWDRVALAAREVLCAQGKHLSAAAYLSIALTRLFRLEGLACGVGVMRDTACLHWEGLYPRRPRARANILAFWDDECRLFLTGVQETACGGLTERAASLRAFLALHMDTPPDLETFARFAEPAPDPKPDASPLRRLAGLFGFGGRKRT